MSEPIVVCILGIPRSGTTLTARIVESLGVYLGEEDELLEARPSNPLGFWEHDRIRQLNTRLLELRGGRSAPDLAPGWEFSADLQPLIDEAHTIISTAFGKRRTWGWKDPWNSLTLPFWQRVVPNLRYIICLRNPIDSALSSAQRGAVSREDAFPYWLNLMTSALVNTSGKARILIQFERYFSDPEAVISDLTKFLDIPSSSGNSATEGQRLAIAAMWNHRTPDTHVQGDPEVPDAIKILYRELHSLAVTLPRSTDSIRATSAHLSVDRLARRQLPVGP